MITITGTVIDLGTSLTSSISPVVTNGLASILHIFMQFLPVILTFSFILLLPTFLIGIVTGVFDMKLWFWQKQDWSSSSTSFIGRQKASKTVWQDERYKINAKIWGY